MENKTTIKVSIESKEFIKRIMINRIKLDKPPLKGMDQAIKLIHNYFKIKDDEYNEMLMEEYKK